MRDRLLFATGEGIGNVIQCIPVIRTIKEKMGFAIDMWHIFGSYPIPKLIPYVDRWFMKEQIYDMNPRMYIGKVATMWAKNYLDVDPVSRLPLLNVIEPLSMTRSEVDTYMEIARNLSIPEEELIWHGECLYEKSDYKCDVVLHNGFNKFGSADWSVKSYPHYFLLGAKLKEAGFRRICSIGAKDEHVGGTENKTGLGLLKSLGIIKNARLFIGNDSGLYHCANALEVKNIVIFTATSIQKNYDARFHKFSTIVGKDGLTCRPCQAERRWTKDCKTRDCRFIDPQQIMNVVKEIL